MRPNLSYIPALTGIRAVAAYMVFFHHYNPFPSQSLAWRFVNELHVGVTIFFVLSGFLITLRYTDKVDLSPQWLARYFRNRFARIYPLYALLTLITFAALWCTDPNFDINKWHSYALIILNLTFLRGFFEEFLFSGVAQGWTLTVEETFYFLAPLLLLVITKSKNRYGVLALFALSSLAFGLLLIKLLPHPYGFFSNYPFVFYRTFFGRVVEFMLGAALAIFIRQHNESDSKVWTGATIIGVIWIVSSVFTLSAISTKDLYSWNNPTGIAFNNLWLPIGIVLLFYGLIFERTWLRQVLETPLAQTLGKSSYAFYLLHVGILSTFVKLYISSNPLVLFAVSLVLAWAVWKWIEEPANHWLRGKVVQQDTPGPELIGKAGTASSLPA